MDGKLGKVLVKTRDIAVIIASVSSAVALTVASRIFMGKK